MPRQHFSVKSRTFWANDDNPVLTLDQDGSGPSLSLLHATQPEIRSAEQDQVDPAGRWRWITNGDARILQRSTGAGWTATEDWITCNKATELITFGKALSMVGGILYTPEIRSLSTSLVLNANTAQDILMFGGTYGSTRTLELDATDPATGAGNTSNSPTIRLRAKYRNGSNTITNFDFYTKHIWTSCAGGTVPISYTTFQINNYEIMRLTYNNGTVSSQLNGAVNLDSTSLALVANNSYLTIRFGTNSNGSGARIYGTGKSHAGAGSLTISTPDVAGTSDIARLLISGNLATSVATWTNITQTGLILTASEKIYPVSGVAGYSVVSTALTLGTLGSIILPQGNMSGAADDAARDALAGDVAGAIAIDTADLSIWVRHTDGTWKHAHVA